MLCQEKTDGAVRRLQEELFEVEIGLNWFWRIETSNLGVQSVGDPVGLCGTVWRLNTQRHFDIIRIYVYSIGAMHLDSGLRL